MQLTVESLALGLKWQNIHDSVIHAFVTFEVQGASALCASLASCLLAQLQALLLRAARVLPKSSSVPDAPLEQQVEAERTLLPRAWDFES